MQVEHPVTEWIAEVNLPAAQVAVGMGIPLWQIPGNYQFTNLFGSLLVCFLSCLLMQKSDVSMEWTMEEGMIFGGKQQLLLHHLILMK